MLDKKYIRAFSNLMTSRRNFELGFNVGVTLIEGSYLLVSLF
jgi:hypothetical protein